MIKWIIETALKNRFLVICFYLLVVFAGIWSIKQTPIDAIPNIGENQIIVFADWPGRSPRDVEDQVVYPLTTCLMGIPRVKTIRSDAWFGFGLVNVIFEDGVDFYWARTRILERLNQAQLYLPGGVVPTLGPDATALGQIFWYTVENGYYCPQHPQKAYGEPGKCPFDQQKLVRSKHDLGELRSLQDWYIRYQINSARGVAEVASVGGFVKQYQIEVDPDKLFSYRIKISSLLKAVKESNLDVGAKVFEEGGAEICIRGLGFVKSIKDLENIVIGTHQEVPIYLKNVARVVLGPDFRRGALDKEGIEVCGGVVHMRYGENPLKVINTVKEKIKELQLGLPAGVRIVPFYDRTELIQRSISTLTCALIIATLVTVVTIVFFLLHFWGSLVISLVLPIGVLISFIIMRRLGVEANIIP
jgi:Cu(I)/Ag(I) efflux system membrane protein CusA/SilA